MDIKKAIKRRGKTISEVARFFGITQPALTQQISNGTISATRVEKIAEFCGCSSLVEFIADDNEIFTCPNCGARFIKIG